MYNRNRHLCLILALLLCGGALAQDPDRAGQADPAPTATPTPGDDAKPADEQAEAPDEFDPTEEVSIDFPLDFPTDI